MLKHQGSPLLVFLPGWARTSLDWQPIVNQLSSYSTLTPTLPGFENKLSRPHTLSDYSRWLHSYLKPHLKANTQLILIGHSFGGQVAVDYLHHYPQLVSKLVLVDSANLRSGQSTQVKIFIFLAHLTSQILPSFILQPLRKYLKIHQLDYHTTTKHDPHLKTTLQTILSHDQSSILSKINQPTLIFWGTKDTSTPLSQAHQLHRLLPNSQLVTVPASHFSFQEQPHLFLQALANFIHV